MAKAHEVVLSPGDTIRLSTDQSRRDTFIHGMGLAGGRILLTGGAELVEAIPGSDWDPRQRIAGVDDGNPWAPGEDSYDPRLTKLRELVLREVERFYRVQMMRPNVVVVSLDYRHLRLRQLCGYRVAYGHQPPDEIRCAYVPFGTY